jgi:hypothetical protein
MTSISLPGYSTIRVVEIGEIAVSAMIAIANLGSRGGTLCPFKISFALSKTAHPISQHPINFVTLYTLKHKVSFMQHFPITKT